MMILGRRLSPLIAIVLIQSCILDAKSLRQSHSDQLGSYVQDQSNELNRTTNRAVRDSEVNVVSCLPDQYQMDYFNELYSTNAVNSFSGNTLHHALRAMEAEKNRSKVTTTTTAEDHEIITRVTDQTRFTPAGMDIANKVVCANILKDMDAEASEISDTALCGWDYVCDYKADRYPNYLFKARCKTARCKRSCSQEKNQHNICQSHGIHVTTLQMRENCEEWVWGQELVPIACTCTTDALQKQS